MSKHARTHARKHPWALTGPWYRWFPLAVAADGSTAAADAEAVAAVEALLAKPDARQIGRGSKPEIQQYAGFDYAREFLAEPQRSLVPRDKDFFHRTLLAPGKSAPAGGEAPSFGTYLREKTQARKLYRSTHGYSYLVVVELHCEVAGFPAVDPKQVEEAGFVIRRLSAQVDPAVAAEAGAALQAAKLAEQKLARMQTLPQTQLPGAGGKALAGALLRPSAQERLRLIEDWTRNKLALDELALAKALRLRTEGWRADPQDPSRGAWVELDDPTPSRDLDELVIPLYRLSPDPRDADHSARGRTLYYGVIPTGGREVEAPSGAPRFDDRHLYEIRCFARRPHPRPECPGELFWSEPTVGYRLAPEADPEGGDRLPITVTVPSFAEVQALADRMATGAAGGVRVVQPADAVLPITGELGDLKAGTRSGLGQICFISILLLFIIALFLIFLFLPIIVFLFQLFFLLRLKFCIPPAIDLDIDLAVDLKLELDLSFQAGAGVDFAAVLAAHGVSDTPEVWAKTQLDLLKSAGVISAQLHDALIHAELAVQLQRILDLGTDFRGSVDPELAADLGFDQWPAGDPRSIPTPGSDSMSPTLPGAAPLAYYPRIGPQLGPQLRLERST